MRTNRLVYLLAAISLSASAASAQAQRAALVSDVDAPIRVPYQETVTKINCQYLTCLISFSPVVPGRRREVDFISCLMVTNAPTTVSFVEMGSLDASNGTLNPTPRVFLPVTAYPGVAGRFSATAPIMVFYTSGVLPSVYVGSSNALQELSCTSTGREVAI